MNGRSLVAWRVLAVALAGAVLHLFARIAYTIGFPGSGGSPQQRDHSACMDQQRQALIGSDTGSSGVFGPFAAGPDIFSQCDKFISTADFTFTPQTFWGGVLLHMGGLLDFAIFVAGIGGFAFALFMFAWILRVAVNGKMDVRSVLNWFADGDTDDEDEETEDDDETDDATSYEGREPDEELSLPLWSGYGLKPYAAESFRDANSDVL